MMLIKQKAFTLIELMVTVSILAIVMALAIPSFKSSVANNRSVGAGSELVTALNFARTEAIRRGAYVSICASSDGAACLAADNWKKGWLVFVDAATSDAGAVVLPTDTTKFLRHWKDIPVTAVVSAVQNTTNITYVRFTGMGVLARAPNDVDSRIFNVSLTNCRGLQKSEITVGLAGLITSKKINCP
jgi:type IV fimbrial biogenesis protein FimT